MHFLPKHVKKISQLHCMYKSPTLLQQLKEKLKKQNKCINRSPLKTTSWLVRRSVGNSLGWSFCWLHWVNSYDHLWPNTTRYFHRLYANDIISDIVAVLLLISLKNFLFLNQMFNIYSYILKGKKCLSLVWHHLSLYCSALHWKASSC